MESSPAIHVTLYFYTIASFILTHSATRGEFIPAGSVIKSISQRSTITVSQFCGDAIQCRSRLDYTKCLQLNACQEVQTCNGRKDFPPAEDPAQTWNLNTQSSGSCFVSEEKPADLPSSLSIPQNARVLAVNSTDSPTGSCFLRRSTDVTNDFSLTFWVKADCANCTVVDLSVVGRPNPVAVRIVDTDHVCLDQDCTPNSHLQNGQWAFIAITVYKEMIKLYVDENQVAETSHSVRNVILGDDGDPPNQGLYSILHAQFFQDNILTPREVKERVTGLVDATLGKCRCTADFPLVSPNDDSMCVNAQGDTLPRFDTTVEFKPPDVILETSKESWASAEQGPVTLTLSFTMSYQIESIEMEFLEPPPSNVTYRLVSNGQEGDNHNFDCSATKCLVELGSLDNSASLQDFKARTADGVKVVLHRDHNDDVRSFILGKITVTGRCDCHGNAASCTIDGATYSCACDANTHTKGPHCRSCLPNFYRQPKDFDCQNTCQCFQDGVADKDDPCDENGGQCLCKNYVEGYFCDRCKPWTFNLDGADTNGCTACRCLQAGSQSCNNITGDCTCNTNVASPNCQVCEDNHYGFATSQGCTSCDCEPAGTVARSLACRDNDGQCTCKTNVQGRSCDRCKTGYYNLQTPNQAGCQACDCNPVGVATPDCHVTTGQCACRGGVITDRTCQPEIISMEPTFGPMVGSTRITIKGRLLGNYTRSVSVYLGNTEQPIHSVTDSAIVIDTKPQGGLSTYNLNVGWVGLANTFKAPSQFSYRNNPDIDGARTVMGSSFVSGGCTVQLFGRNLESVKHPRLDVRLKNRPGDIASGPCYHIGGRAVCLTPDVSRLYASASDKFEMTAIFDGVTVDLGEVVVKPDPVIKNVGNIEFPQLDEDSISISGKNLLSACETSDYTVHVGRKQCTITHISNTVIECEPPIRPSDGDDKVPIKVSIGHIEWDVGTLEYLEWYETTLFIIIISCIAAVIAIVIGTIILCRCLRHRRRHKSSAPAKAANYNGRAATQQMNTYSDLTSVTDGNVYSNGSRQNGTIRVESVFREPKKGIVNSAAETNVMEEEFLPHVEPGLKKDVEMCFVGGGSFSVGTTCVLVGQKARLVDGVLRRQSHSGQKLRVKSFVNAIHEILQSPGDSNSLLTPWAQQTLKECLRFRRFKHNHLLGMVGIGVEQHRIHILYEHMSKGTLKTLVADTEQEYTKLLGFSQQIAEGIAFLASKDITHKDVAARNCMVDEYSVVKLVDASFAWDFFPNEYVYNQQRERYLPLRWMAPESIDHGYYDTRTDVWSFGVLVWELLTRGSLPFHDVTDNDVSNYIQNGYVLGKPETVSDKLYTLLRSCWCPDNEGRPSIAAVSSALCNILESDDNSYANVATHTGIAGTEAHYYSSTNISGV